MSKLWGGVHMCSIVFQNAMKAHISGTEESSRLGGLQAYVSTCTVPRITSLLVVERQEFEKA